MVYGTFNNMKIKNLKPHMNSAVQYNFVVIPTTVVRLQLCQLYPFGGLTSFYQNIKTQNKSDGNFKPPQLFPIPPVAPNQSVEMS